MPCLDFLKNVKILWILLLISSVIFYVNWMSWCQYLYPVEIVNCTVTQLNHKVFVTSNSTGWPLGISWIRSRKFPGESCTIYWINTLKHSGKSTTELLLDYLWIYHTFVYDSESVRKPTLKLLEPWNRCFIQIVNHR